MGPGRKKKDGGDKKDHVISSRNSRQVVLPPDRVQVNPKKGCLCELP